MATSTWPPTRALMCNGPLFSLTPSFISVDYTIEDITPLVGIRITEFVILTQASSGITDTCPCRP